MNKVKRYLLVFATTVILVVTGLTGCQSVTKNFGGSMTLELEPNQKLVTITWKDDDLWYLTRPMREDESPETYTFQQSTDLGVMEGTVTVVEMKGEKHE